MITIDLSKFAVRGLLRGRSQGRIHFAELSGLVSEASPDETVFLDFRGITAVNGSWLNAAIGELFRWSAQERNNVYPVLLCFPEDDLDELELVAQVNSQAFPLATEAGLPIQSLRLVGPLDDTLRNTLLAVLERGETTGSELWSDVKDEGIGASAWNNRLKDLFDLRLLSRRKQGRKQLYKVVATEVQIDG